MKQVHDEEQLKQASSPTKMNPLAKEGDAEGVTAEAPLNADGINNIY